jgi:polyisoprenoid-binding protein YceI
MYVHTFAEERKSFKTQKQKTMKKTRSILVAAMLFISAVASAQATKWNVDGSHSNVKFSVSHLVISDVEGYFKKFDGTIDAPTADFNNAVVNFTVDVNSINTDNDMRDKHLKSDDFFNAEKYPNMTFKSTSFKKVSGNKYTLEGNLTIRDVTKKVKFDVTYGGTVKDPYGNIKAGFKTSTKISRKAYGLKWSAMTEAGGAVVGDEVTITLKLEFAQAK